MKQIKQNEKGFTLVELVVVIAILVVLAALMVPRIIGSVQDARRSAAIGDARSIASEIATWNAQELSKDPGDKPKPAPILDKKPITGTELETMGLDKDDLPDTNYVEINVDANGEVELNIKPYS